VSARRVLFYTIALSGGGAESHALRVMNHLDRSRYQPELAVSRRGGNYEKFLRDDVPIHGLGIDRIPSSTGRVAVSGVALRRLLSRDRYDVLCSLLELPNLVGILATRGLANAPRVLPCVQIPPTIEFERTRWGRDFMLPALRRAYPHADRVVALSHGVKSDLVRMQPQLEGRVEVVHNACVDARVRAAAKLAIDEPLPKGPLLVACGRLTYQKGLPHLIEAMTKVRERHPAELWILGEGPDRAQLEALIRERGLTESVRLLGFRDSPQRYMARASLFVLSSLYEGFGNVVAEAMASGAAVVSTDCPYGPSEILVHEESGLLVPVADASALAGAIVRMLDDEAFRARIAEAGRARAELFDAQRIADAYADLFDRVLASPA
jgi:glycosyltransferase involved in cell wall biosynthesis